MTQPTSANNPKSVAAGIRPDDRLAWLAGQGWRTTVDRAGELAASYGKQLPGPLRDAMTKTELVTVDLP
ncbi:hypothetical protein [Amycolatopsis sp. GA6-003]|uniref:hypothetical protein n=1 Tax=Amycolatopsis sp. GA6-003 TaxID=2652444 RepID=UPI00391738F3